MYQTVASFSILCVQLKLSYHTLEKQKTHCYGLFIDFSNAYNLVRHNILFDRLKKIRNEDLIGYIKATYSRNVIKIGKQSFKPNIEVTQGSIISPYLFDIYIEDLFNEIDDVRKIVPVGNILGT